MIELLTKITLNLENTLPFASILPVTSARLQVDQKITFQESKLPSVSQ